MNLKRVMAVPLFVVGGLGLIAGFLVTIGTGLYYDWQAVQALLDGDIFVGLIGIPLITMIAFFICSLLMLPFNGLVALGGWLWETGEKSEVVG
jgi:hypothetical protein